MSQGLTGRWPALETAELFAEAPPRPNGIVRPTRSFTLEIGTRNANDRRFAKHESEGASGFIHEESPAFDPRGFVIGEDCPNPR
jgi:hypothetical protein